MKTYLFLFTTFWISGTVSAQPAYLNNLYNRLHRAPEDTTKVHLLGELGTYYSFNQFDSGILYGHKTIALSNKLRYAYGRYMGFRSLFFSYNCQGNYPKALEAVLENYRIAEEIKEDKPLTFAGSHYALGLLNREMENFSVSVSHLHKSIDLYKAAGLTEPDMFPSYAQLALAHLKVNPDSSIWYAQKGYALSRNPNRWVRFRCMASATLGFVLSEKGEYQEAKNVLYTGIEESRSTGNLFFLAWTYNVLANVFKKTSNTDSCIYYAGLSLPLWRAHNFGSFGVNASALLTEVYESKKISDSSLKYMKIMLEAKDSVFSQTKLKEFEKFVFNEEKRKADMRQEQEEYKNRIKTYALISGIGVLLIIAFILWRNARQKQMAKIRIERAYDLLKSTQSQLIQSEKMASLGELTAGIAHEIQNPLNFVNNFSDVNTELLSEMKEEMERGNIEEAKALAGDVIDNEEKIRHHGKRADAIVKGMLQHSRTGSGQKDLVDINALAEEYLRLAYHGMRGKDNTFNAKTKFNPDPSIGQISIVPQEIGRVLINLLNNAFYAVHEKKKTAGEDFDPVVELSTSTNKNGKVEVRVKDNGSGISTAHRDKIFQPFFTTKPTGEGTGLGLSLAYDIVTKGHGGELKVDTVENEGSTFTIVLPV